MKIRLAILDKDISYLNRIVSAFNMKYSDKLEIYSFTDVKVAVSNLDNIKVDVLLATDSFEIDREKLPAKCGFAYLVEQPDIESVREQPAICKFQKADLIYKQILSLYSENAANISGIKLDDETSKMILFTSPGGGTGSSTMASALAMTCAGRGKKVIYVNLEKFGLSDVFFSAEGQFDMSDIIYALKSGKTNLQLKLESTVKQDKSGVYFISGSKVALDMQELNTEDILRLISELKLSGDYDYIIADMDFELSKGNIDIYKRMHSIVLVGDGSEISNIKISRAYAALAAMEQSMDLSITERMGVIYNKFSNKTGKVLEDIGLKSLSGAPRFEHATAKQIAEQLSSMNMFEKIL